MGTLGWILIIIIGLIVLAKAGKGLEMLVTLITVFIKYFWTIMGVITFGMLVIGLYVHGISLERYENGGTLPKKERVESLSVKDVKNAVLICDRNNREWTLKIKDGKTYTAPFGRKGLNYTLFSSVGTLIMINTPWGTERDTLEMGEFYFAGNVDFIRYWEKDGLLGTNFNYWE